MPAKKKKGEVVKETIIKEYHGSPKSKKTTKKTTSAKKKTTKKKTHSKKTDLPKSELKLEKVLIENFIGLQKVMVNLSGKFEDLSGKISKLLELFELSAKALAEKDLSTEKVSRDDDVILSKVDELSDQNKVIARGLLLMNDKLEEEPESHGMRPVPRHHLPKEVGPLERLRNSNAQYSTQDKNQPTDKTSSVKGYEKSMFAPESNEAQTFKKLPRGENATGNF